jgi:hypothetical protein
LYLQLTRIKYNGKTFEEQFCEDYNYIEASDLFLREIELLVNKDIEFNKNRIRIEDRLKNSKILNGIYIKAIDISKVIFL